MQNLQAFQPIEGAGLYPQLFEIAHYVGLHTLQAGLCNRKTVRRHAEGQQLGSHNAVVALGNLALQHFHILAPHFAVLVILHGDIDFILAFRAAPVVDKGELERQRGVKVIEERTPAAENRRLILGACHGIVDVLIFHRLCIEPAGELAHPVRVHHQIRDRLLGRQRSFPVSGLSGAALLIFCFLQSHPPFPQRPDG